MKIIIIIFILGLSLNSFAQIPFRLPPIISNHAVFQQSSEVKLWGWGPGSLKVGIVCSWNPSDTIFAGIGGDCTWEAKVKTPKAGGSFSIEFWCNNKVTKVEDILIGEVWLCSGQSNMELPTKVGILDDADVLKNCYNLYYQNIRILADMSRVLGKKEEAGRYMALAETIRATINREWFNTITGHYATASQTSDILPLALGVVPQESRQQVIDNIARTISENGGKFRVGHLGLPGFMESLVDHGLGEVVYNAVNTTEFPGWGYMISQGATTVWEGWSLKNGTYQAEESMTMLLGVSRFFYEGIAGIQEPNFYDTREFAPGYRQIGIKPHVLGDLTYASASIKTIKGIISSSWKKTDNSLNLDVTIPVNATASVSVPLIGLKNATITEGGIVVWKDGTYVEGVAGITGGKPEAGYITFDTGSGEYRFEAHNNNN